ncbi:Y-family DNA polymerase [Luteipulveratus mongoliensis]|uniref:UmuC domain-containing protein n=1 Tax=Luteipulveratus mongoliensis TaxID=571913 RepID=A0A0K1JP33_9MICO|nr:DNA polymerase IV [Luteipulveratus mongoliensis]AKU18471.1 hypothetical protein VV02_25785 [Luteipulveratus mongoliensis]
MLLHADCDAFFASVEQRDARELRGVPMAVVNQVVMCASYEARALGVTAGTPVQRALRRWPQLRVVPPRSDVYDEASEQLFALFRSITPLVEPGSMEEAFLDVTDRGDPSSLATDLRTRARRDLGLPVSVGVGSTKLIAKMASRRAKPDGLVVVDRERETWLRPRLRLADLWGVGPATSAKLHEAGLVTVGDLTTYDEVSLAEILPKAAARRLIAVSRGTDDATIRLPKPRRSVSVQRTISPATRNHLVIEQRITHAVDTALERIAGDPRTPRRLEVVVRYDDRATVSTVETLEPSVTEAADLKAVALQLLERTAYADDGRGVTLAGITLHLPPAKEPADSM